MLARPLGLPVALGAVLITWTPPDPPGVRTHRDIPENATTTYYDVRGVSAAALRAELTRLGPKENGVPAFGRYYANIRYSYSSQVLAGACAPTVRVELISTTTLPRWIDQRFAEPALQRQWKDFLDKLALHESGHRAISVATANEMHRAMNATRS